MARLFFFLLLQVLLALMGCIPTRAEGLTVRVDYNFHVKPLLSDRCFRCHGPDAGSRKADLRLDTRQALTREVKDQPGQKLIVPGQPEQSPLYQRLVTKDADDLMPPPDSHLSLKPEEIALIRRWIEEGAEWKPHWAFVPVTEQAAPENGTDATHRTQGFSRIIDAWAGAKLQTEGLTPAPEASRETWFRRVSLDLTGLPPTLEQIDAFLADESPNAYEKAVDRLLASPAFGERMASPWLDAARFGDTFGYQADRENNMWPWRDWVVRAFNANLPYDQFLTWQMAGDLLPNATPDQRLATGFHRNHRQTNEGGSVEEEFRAEYAIDRVNTTATAVLGLTMECCRCHDHKYDPLLQKEYFQMMAFFNQIDESGLYSHFTNATPTPALPLYEGDQQARHEALQAKITGLEEALKKAGAPTAAVAGVFNPCSKDTGGLQGLKTPATVAAFSFEDVKDNKTPDVTAEKPAAQLKEQPEQIDGKVGKALRFDGENSVVMKESGQFSRVQPFSFSLWLRQGELRPGGGHQVVFHRCHAFSDAASQGYEFLLEDGRPVFSIIHFWPGNALRVRGKEPLPLNEWAHFTITYDGSSRAAGVRLYKNGAPLALEVVRDKLTLDITEGNPALTIGQRMRDMGFKNGAVDEFRVFDRELSETEARHLAGLPLAETTPEQWIAHFHLTDDPGAAKIRADLLLARKEENALMQQVREIMVMADDLPQPRPIYLLKRGAYDAPGEPVFANVPAALPTMAADLPRNRLGFARWLVQPENPLVSRVAVNRFWALFFGRGIVDTPEDFGFQGHLPTHPELLDALAAQFMKSGWNVKQLCRDIVLSRTYRQSSRADAALTARDPFNKWLARGPSQRLSGEQLRDSALLASGLLVPKMGGPGVYPYQPAGVWEDAGTGKSYPVTHGENHWRRSLYTFNRRTAPPPSMLTFDATSREACTVKRQTTNTPLQALVLLNDPQIMEACRVLAGKLMQQGLQPAAQTERAFRMLLSRQPSEKESVILGKLYQEQLVWYQQHPAEAKALLAIGETAPSQGMDEAQTAAVAVLANALMNFDEFVMNR